MTKLKNLDIILAHGPELSAGGLDYYQLGLWAASLPRTRVLAVNPGLPREELLRRLKAFLYLGEEHRVLLAALDPLRRARLLIQLLLQEIGIHPEFLLTLDLQEALSYPDAKACSLKAHHLIGVAASMLTRAEPVGVQELPVSPRVLVWGDSYAALKAAVSLAHLGHPVLWAYPGPTPAPLLPGAPVTEPPEPPVASLLTAADASPLISKVPKARFLELEGQVGHFLVKLEVSGEIRQELVGGMILAPELHLTPNPKPLADHFRIFSLSELERRLKEQEKIEGLFPPRDGLLQAAFIGGDSHPLSLKRTLKAISRLQTQDPWQVALFLRDAKVGAPGLEAALEAALAQGLILFKVSEPPKISLTDDLPQVSFFDPVMLSREVLACDLVVLDEVYRPDPDNHRLAHLLGLFSGPAGFLQKDNVRLLPVVTNRQGIYVAGPGRAVMDLDQALAEADTAVSMCHELLGQGLASAPKGRAVVDRGRCTLCLTCYRLCPHRAISWDNRAIIHELACQGCGTCAAHCPNEAIQIRNFTDDQVVAAMATLDPRLTPKIFAFLCQNSAWEAYQAAIKEEGLILPLGFIPLRLPCAGKLDIDYLLRGFTYGAQGILVMGCPLDNCRSDQGNCHALWRVERAQGLLAEVGIDPRRLLYRPVAANAPRDFQDAVMSLLEILSQGQAA
jgi:coenzyme F420-reducing hydrogenase delta subunit/Pyruvate/2-oxoacid:ferredoxin oxidoreductase delta subunit